VSTNGVPRLFAGLVDDAAVFPPGALPLAEAVVAHRAHRAAWYADMVGPLMLPASMLNGDLPDALDDAPVLGLVGDTGLAKLTPLTERLSKAGLRLSQVELAVAKRGEDPLPGLATLLENDWDVPVFAEIPMTFGLFGALDEVARARAGGQLVAPKFRTGGLAAELFPSAADLARVIVACRDRELPFKLTAGLHRAVRHNDPETGFVHHGFLNVLAATIVADGGATTDPIKQMLAETDPIPLIETVRARRDTDRPLWTGFGACSVTEPLEDLVTLQLL
jgi:hypothetical protein